MSETLAIQPTQEWQPGGTMPESPAASHAGKNVFEITNSPVSQSAPASPAPQTAPGKLLSYLAGQVAAPATNGEKTPPQPTSPAAESPCRS